MGLEIASTPKLGRERGRTMKSSVRRAVELAGAIASIAALLLMLWLEWERIVAAAPWIRAWAGVIGVLAVAVIFVAGTAGVAFLIVMRTVAPIVGRIDDRFHLPRFLAEWLTLIPCFVVWFVLMHVVGTAIAG